MERRSTPVQQWSEGESACAARSAREGEGEARARRLRGRPNADEEGGYRRKKDAAKWPSDEEDGGGSGMEGIPGERVETHILPAPTTSTTSWDTPPASTGASYM